jgi:uncharacterized protein
MALRLEEWLTANQAAAELAVSRPRIHQLVAAGELEARRVAGRLFVRRLSLQGYQEGRRGRGRPRRQPPTLGAIRAQRDRILAVARRHGALDIRVFGSVARNAARPDSDIDFLVSMEPARTVVDVAELIVDLEEMLGYPVDVVEIKRPSHTASRIKAEAVGLD